MAKTGLMARGVQFFHHVVPQIVRPLHTLWHEIIGFLFLALALLAVPSGVRIVRNFNGDAESLFRLVLTAIFVLVMGGYGISSFRRARKISKS